MSLKLAAIRASEPKKKMDREQILALMPALKFEDGRTIQSHKDETDIVKIMARFDRSQTISHLSKFEGMYADFSEFDYHEQLNKLQRGDEIFAALPAELRKEFHQDPAEFFQYVNDPKNVDELRKKLPGLAEPGRQLDAITPPSADLDAAKALVKAAEDAAKPPPAEPPVE